MDKLKAIKNILYNSDVRNMRSTLAAIEGVIATPDGPVLSINVFDDEAGTGPLRVRVEMKSKKSYVQPKHIDATLDALGKYGDKLFGASECNDPDCPVHGTKACIESRATTDLSELFKNLEAELFKKGGAA
jgi:hypothetical protein